MPVRIEIITMGCRDERILSAFWTGALDYDVVVDQPGDWMVLQDPGGTGPSIGLQVVPEPKVVKNRVHLDLIPTEGKLEVEIRRLEDLGARQVRYVENDPDETGDYRGSHRDTKPVQTTIKVRDSIGPTCGRESWR